MLCIDPAINYNGADGRICENGGRMQSVAKVSIARHSMSIIQVHTGVARFFTPGQTKRGTPVDLSFLHQSFKA